MRTHTHSLVGLISLLAIATAGCGIITPAEESECLQVPLSQVLGQPDLYHGKSVCTEGRLRIEFEGMALFALGEPHDEYAYTNMSPGIDVGRAVELGLRTGDIVSASGVFFINEDCFNSFCIGGSDPFYFAEPEFELHSRIPARETCTTVSIEELYQNPMPYDGQMICTDGFIGRQDFYSILMPENYALENDTLIRMAMWQLFLGDEMRPFVPGEHLSVAGLFSVFESCYLGETSTQSSFPPFGTSYDESPPCHPPLDFQLYELNVLIQISPWDACEQVDLRDVLSRPNEFDARLICGTGQIDHDTTLQDWPINHLTIEPSPPVDFGPIDVQSIWTEELGLYVDPPTDISFVGYFDTWEECFVQGTPSPAPKVATECKPSMELEILEMEFLAR